MLSQRFSNCLLQLLRYKVNAETYDSNTLQDNQRNRASYTHNILPLFCNIPCEYFTQDKCNLQNYVINNIRYIQNNITPTFENRENIINQELSCLDNMQGQTQNFFNELINISLNDNYVFDNDFYNRINNCLTNNPINNNEKFLLSLLIKIHIIRLFNNFYYKWLVNENHFNDDIEYIRANYGINFYPDDLTSNYLQGLITYVENNFNNIDNIDNIRNFIEYLENMVARYVGIQPPF